MSDRFSLVRWRDAKTDPPEAGRVVLTDEGMARAWQVGRVWEYDLPDMEGPCNPSVWCDPSPPSDDALTAEDAQAIEQLLRYTVKETDFDGDGNPMMAGLHARLRRAIEEAER